MSKLDEALNHHQQKLRVKALIVELLIEALSAKTEEEHNELLQKVEVL